MVTDIHADKTYTHLLTVFSQFPSFVFTVPNKGSTSQLLLFPFCGQMSTQPQLGHPRRSSDVGSTAQEDHHPVHFPEPQLLPETKKEQTSHSFLNHYRISHFLSMVTFLENLN